MKTLTIKEVIVKPPIVHTYKRRGKMVKAQKANDQGIEKDCESGACGEVKMLGFYTLSNKIPNYG